MNAGPDLTVAAYKMAGSLLLVLVLLWVLYRFIRHHLPAGQNAGKGRLIQVLGSHYLGAKKSISVVQVPGSILVLGISSDRINLLDRIDDPSVLEQLHQNAQSKPGMSFKGHLQRFSTPLRSRIQAQNQQDRTEPK